MRTKIQGIFTIEAAVIVPIILVIFGFLLHMIFYYHDKIVLTSAVHDTVAIGVSREGMSEIELEYYFFSRFEGKLMLFSRVECSAQIEEEQVTIKCDGSKDSMSVKIECTMNRTEPENYIRDIRKLKKLGEGIGDNIEDILQK